MKIMLAEGDWAEMLMVLIERFHIHGRTDGRTRCNRNNATQRGTTINGEEHKLGISCRFTLLALLLLLNTRTPTAFTAQGLSVWSVHQPVLVSFGEEKAAHRL